MPRRPWTGSGCRGAARLGAGERGPVDRAILERHTGSHDFTFVLDRLAAAVERARAAAGDRDVYVMGGGRTVAGCLAQGLLDQLRVHVAVETSAVATHLTYDVLRD